MQDMGVLQNLLYGGLWHTTRPNRVPSIAAAGEILVEPNIDDKELWGSRDHPTFVRKIGGISLFDFHNFNPREYSVSHPLSSWQYFVPHRVDWGGAVWLNIDRGAVSNSFWAYGRMLDTTEVILGFRTGWRSCYDASGVL